MDVICWVAAVIALISLITGCISSFFFGRVCGQYFDNEFKKRHLELPWATNMFSTRRTARGSTYALCLLVSGRQGLGQKRINPPYNQINYAKLARKQDWVLAIIFWSAAAICFLSVTILCIVSGIELHIGMI